MGRVIKNMSASVLQRIRNLPGSGGHRFLRMLVLFAHERLIYRVSVSRHKGSFALKGGMLVRTYGVGPERFTHDLDFLGLNSADAESLNAIFGEIMSLDEDDGLEFDIDQLRVADIIKGQPAIGKRLRTTAYLGKTQIPICVDIGFGDVLADPRHEVEYLSMIGLKPAILRAYPPAKVIVEKLHAIVDHGLSNNRMKDFYDLWTIPEAVSVTGEEIEMAVRETFGRRNVQIPASKPPGLTGQFAMDPRKMAQWAAYLDMLGIEQVSLSFVAGKIWERLEAPCSAACQESAE